MNAVAGFGASSGDAALKAAAKETGAADIDLPYWNWYADGAMPPIFTAGDENSNPLWHPRKHTTLNPASLDRDFLDNAKLLPATSAAWNASFSVPLEYNPHGTVHSVIGLDMGSIPTAARDPIFWLHHCNIDRLWTFWVKKKNGQNPPAGSAWRTRAFKFDTAGTMIATAGGVLDSETQLKYKYDDDVPFPGASPLVMAQSRIKIESTPGNASGGRLRMMSTSVAATTAVSSTGAISLGAQSVDVAMKVAPPVQTELHALVRAAPRTRASLTGAWLVLDGVEIGRDGADGGFSFGIKASLPGSDRKVSLGELNTFNWPAGAATTPGHDHSHGAATGPVTLTFPLTDVLTRLQVTDPAQLSELKVSFEAAHADADPGKEFVRIKSMTIKTSSAPIR